MSLYYQLQEYRDDNFENSNIIIMDEIPEYNIEDYDLFNAKDFQKYLADIEKSVRTSMEYREYIQYLRNYMNMNKCVFFSNVSNINTAKIKIQLHHHPFTLYDIVVIIYNKRSAMGESLEVELVAKEAMYIHYFLYVGLVPLAETVHELVHNQLLFIPLNVVLGKYEDFIQMYEKYIPEETMDKLKTYKELTQNYDIVQNTKILQTTPIYLKLPGSDPNQLGAYGLHKLTDAIESVKNRLECLKQQNNIKGIIVDTTYDSNSYNTDKNELTKPFIIFNDKGEILSD